MRSLNLTSPEWPQERIDALRILWDAGKSAAFIGDALGMSRGAVSGKIDRLGLSKRDRSVSMKNWADSRASGVKAKRSPRVKSAPKPQLTSLFDLTNETCRWPMWADGERDGFYCGAPEANMAERVPYCPFHSQMSARKHNQDNSVEIAA